MFVVVRRETMEESSSNADVFRVEVAGHEPFRMYRERKYRDMFVERAMPGGNNQWMLLKPLLNQLSTRGQIALVSMGYAVCTIKDPQPLEANLS